MVSKMSRHDVFRGNLRAFMESGEIETKQSRLGHYLKSNPIGSSWMFLGLPGTGAHRGRKFCAILDVFGGFGTLHASIFLLKSVQDIFNLAADRKMLLRN